MPLFALVYRYIANTELVAEHRPEHRAYLRKLADAGELVLAGHLGEPGPPSGLLIFDVESIARVEELADNQSSGCHQGEVGSALDALDRRRPNSPLRRARALTHRRCHAGPLLDFLRDESSKSFGQKRCRPPETAYVVNGEHGSHTFLQTSAAEKS
jgi:uncharacterized protein